METTPSPRQQIRLLSMSTEELRNLADAEDWFVYTAAERVRFDRTKALVGAELHRRQTAGGR